MSKRKAWLLFGIVVIVAMLGATWLLREMDKTQPADVGGVTVETPQSSEPATEAAQPGSSAVATQGAQVPIGTIYELVDQLGAAGFSPAGSGELTVTYQGTLDSIKVEGSFENTSATSFDFHYADGVWKVDGLDG